MPHSSLKHLMLRALTKDMLLNLEDGLKAEALNAHEVAKVHSGLKNIRRIRSTEGVLRFNKMEERFEEVCKEHGGKALEGGVIPNTDRKTFQPFFRFEAGGQGFIFGLAMMPEPKTLPHKNKSRAAGVSINHYLVPSLFDDEGPKRGDIFVLLLVSRDRTRAGFIEEIAIGVIDSKYESFLFYEPLDKFFSGEEEVTSTPPSDPTPPSPPVSLKKAITPFIPPEVLPEEKKDTGTE